MHAIQPSDLLPTAQYERIRTEYLAWMIRHKHGRRIRVHPALSVLFESRHTVLCHLQEIIRAESITCPVRIQQQIAEYAPLVPEPGTLTVTALVDGTASEGAPEIAHALATTAGTLSILTASVRVEGHALPGTAELGPVHYLRFPMTAPPGEAVLSLTLFDQRFVVPLPLGLHPISNGDDSYAHPRRQARA